MAAPNLTTDDRVLEAIVSMLAYEPTEWNRDRAADWLAYTMPSYIWLGASGIQDESLTKAQRSALVRLLIDVEFVARDAARVAKGAADRVRLVPDCARFGANEFNVSEAREARDNLYEVQRVVHDNTEEMGDRIELILDTLLELVRGFTERIEAATSQAREGA